MVLKVRKNVPMNILFGPPVKEEDCPKMMDEFFSKKGKTHNIRGTTSSIAANYFGKTMEVSLDYVRKDIPPIAYIEGVDLVTEGVVTINQVLIYAKDYLGSNELYEEWSKGKDGASLISQLLFEEATEIHFIVGRAINPIHQNPDLPITFNNKMDLVDELYKCLDKMGKKVKVKYY